MREGMRAAQARARRKSHDRGPAARRAAASRLGVAGAAAVSTHTARVLHTRGDTSTANRNAFGGLHQLGTRSVGTPAAVGLAQRLDHANLRSEPAVLPLQQRDALPLGDQLVYQPTQCGAHLLG